jgi:hypothetical protein
VATLKHTEKNTYSSYSKKDESTVENKCEECVLEYLPDCVKRSKRFTATIKDPALRGDSITDCGVIAETVCSCHLSKSKWIDI